MKRLLPLMLLLLLTGCGEARLDGSSPEAFKESLQAVQGDLSNSENAELSKAITAVIMKHNFAEMMKRGMQAAANGKQPDITEADLLTPEVLAELDGLTAAEIVELAGDFPK